MVLHPTLRSAFGARQDSFFLGTLALKEFMKTALLGFLPLLFLTSCATITRGVNEKLKVTSNPSAAEVVLSSGEKGVTPAQFVKRRKESFSVTVSKPGYVPQTVNVVSKFSATGGGAMAGNVIAGGVIGIGIDAVSGATFSLYPNPVSVDLVPRGQGPRRQQSATLQKQKPPAASSPAPSTPKPQ